jgi:hypothetical protein
MCRIRKAAIAGTFYVGEVSEVDFNAGGTIYLTVVDDYGLWAKAVRLVSGVAKMDYDVAYSDQHANFDPVPVLGSHRVGKLVNGTVTVQLGPSLDTASWVEGSSISTYLWAIAGASSISSTSAARPTATFTSAGTYLAYCTVTAANGKTFKGVRYVIIYDDNNPLKDGVMRSVIYDTDGGGMSFNVEMYDDTETSQIRKRALVLVVTEDTLSAVSVRLPCPISGAEKVFAVGWIGQENINYHKATGQVEFTVHNAAYWLKNMEGYLSGVEFKTGTATDWTNCPLLTVGRMLFHFMHWRTTATRVMDVVVTTDTRYGTGFKTITGTLWEQINQIANQTIWARPGVDRFNRLFINIEPQMVAFASRSGFPGIMTLTSADWVGEVRGGDTHDALSMLYWSGIYVDTSKAASTYVSLSPGHIQKRYGRPEPQSNYLVTGQAGSNQMCGLYFGWVNDRREFEITLASAHRMIDIWPRQYVNLTITAAEDPRGIGYSGRAIPRRIEYTHGPRTGFISTRVYFETETFEGLAINGDIPDSVDEGVIPPFPPLPELPDLPPLPPILPGDPGDESIGPSTVVISTTNFGILYTTNFNEVDGANVEWHFMSSGFPTDYQNRITRIKRCPSGLLIAGVNYDNNVYNATSHLFVAGSLGSEWSQLWALTDVLLPTPGTRAITFGVNQNASEQIALVGGAAGNMGFALGDRNGFSLASSGLDGAASFGDLEYIAGKWFLSHSESDAFLSEAWSRFSAAGGIEVNTKNYLSGQDYADSPHRMKRGGDNLYIWNNDTRYLRRVNSSPPNGDTSVSSMPGIGALGYNPYNFLCASPTGQNLLGGINTIIAQKSTDYGATWGGVDVSLGVGYSVFENCASESAFIAATVQSMKYTPDHGTTWIDKSGNLPSVAPLCAIRHILHVGW